MKNKKYITLVVIIIVLLGIVMFCTIPKRKLKIDNYDKYTLSIQINAVKSDRTKEVKIITVNYDGITSNISLVPDAVSYSGYLVSDTLYYEENNKSSRLEVQNKYTDLYDIFKNIKGYDRESKTDVYYVLLKPETINKILDCLYFGEKTEKSSQGKLTLEEKRIKSFNLKFGGIDGYEEITLNFNYNELKDDFKINIPKKIIEDSKETVDNPFRIIK